MHEKSSVGLYAVGTNNLNTEQLAWPADGSCAASVGCFHVERSDSLVAQQFMCLGIFIGWHNNLWIASTPHVDAAQETTRLVHTSRTSLHRHTSSMCSRPEPVTLVYIFLSVQLLKNSARCAEEREAVCELKYARAMIQSTLQKFPVKANSAFQPYTVSYFLMIEEDLYLYSRANAFCTRDLRLHCHVIICNY